MSGIERQPKSPEDLRIDFSPEHMFGSELDTVRQIAIARSGGENGFNQETFLQYIRTLEKLRLAYIGQAERQGEPSEVKILVNTAFYSLMATTWSAHRGFDARISQNVVPEKIAYDIRWQNNTASYLQELTAMFGEREAVQHASIFWKHQQRMYDQFYGKGQRGVSFDKFKNGVLRSVALEYVLRKNNRWNVKEGQDIAVDAIDKIDLLAESSNGNTFAFQIKEANKEDQSIVRTGWNVTLIPPEGELQDGYLGEFQKGLRRYAKHNSVPSHKMRGVFMELTASENFINKSTGVPRRELAGSLASYLKELDQQHA